MIFFTHKTRVCGGAKEASMEFYTSEDFCRIYKIHPVAMRRLAREGKQIERVQLEPRTFRYRLREAGGNGSDIRAV